MNSPISPRSTTPSAVRASPTRTPCPPLRNQPRRWPITRTPSSTAILLGLRREHLVPHLPGGVALGAQVLANAAVTARWRLGNGRVLQIDINLSAAAVAHTLQRSRSFCDACRPRRATAAVQRTRQPFPVGEHP